MKKLISLCLSVIMCFSVTTSALAASQSEFDGYIRSLAHSSNMSAKELLKLSESDRNNFAELGISSEVLTPNSINEDGKIVYRVMFGSVANDIVTLTTANGERVFHFYEGDIHTELKIVENVGLYVNGTLAQPVKSSFTETSDAGQTRARYSEWSTNPYYPISSYVIPSGVYEDNTVSWGVSTLVGLAVGAITSIVLYAIGNVFTISLSGQLMINAFTGFAAAMQTRCEIYGMEDAYFSFSFTRYATDEALPLEFSYMYEGACYSRRDCKGTVYPHTMYYLNCFT